ncbi:sensor histidine kinase [Phenylobacterium sp.]|uniref:sensor histidine kinase n=1 Tax=Phenylobacterium sp. TaxID=1871053 RepID=UPI0025ED2C8E|nr:sensor histidine kinase [Phenylobacterium sp.]
MAGAETVIASSVPGLTEAFDLAAAAACGAQSCPSIIEGQNELKTLQRSLSELRTSAVEESQKLEEQRQVIQQMQLLAQESDHRLLNGLQLVASLLSVQARKTTSPEAAVELGIAARRVATIGNLHRRLHGMDQEDVVDLTKYLESVCHEIVEMLAVEGRAGAISFGGIALQTPRTVAIPLGFICAELLTNAAKHANGDIEVRLSDAGGGRYALAVTDGGPGLARGFDPKASTGLGMKIIASLVRDIAGELVVGARETGQGARFTVLFSPVASGR